MEQVEQKRNRSGTSGTLFGVEVEQVEQIKKAPMMDAFCPLFLDEMLK